MATGIGLTTLCDSSELSFLPGPPSLHGYCEWQCYSVFMKTARIQLEAVFLLARILSYFLRTVPTPVDNYVNNDGLFTKRLSILLSYSRKYLEKHDLELKKNYEWYIYDNYCASPNNQYKRTSGWSAVSEFYLGHMQQSIEGGGFKVMEYPPVCGCGRGRVWGLGPLVQKPF